MEFGGERWLDGWQAYLSKNNIETTPPKNSTILVGTFTTYSYSIIGNFQKILTSFKCQSKASIYKWIYVQLKSIILRMWKIMLHILVHRYILRHHSECTSNLLCSFTCMWFEFVCACILSQTLCWIYWAVSFYWYWEIFRGKLPHLVLLHTPNQITH